MLGQPEPGKEAAARWTPLERQARSHPIPIWSWDRVASRGRGGGPACIAFEMYIGVTRCRHTCQAASNLALSVSARICICPYLCCMWCFDARADTFKLEVVQKVLKGWQSAAFVQRKQVLESQGYHVCSPLPLSLSVPFTSLTCPSLPRPPPIHALHFHPPHLIQGRHVEMLRVQSPPLIPIQYLVLHILILRLDNFTTRVFNFLLQPNTY